MLLAILIGILTNILDITDSPALMMYILSVILLANFYRVKKVKTIEKGRAGFLSVLVPGLGEIYSQKTKIGFILIILHFVIYLSAIAMEENSLVFAWVVLTILSAIHANMTAAKMNDILSKQSLQKLAVLKSRLLQVHAKPGTVIAPDTNILMHEHLMLVAAFRESNIQLFVSKQVMKELDGLKSSDSRAVRKSAQLGFDILEMYQQAGRVRFIEVPDHNYLKKRHLTGGPDEKIIGTCLQALEKNIPLIFLSNDKGARILARNSNIPTLSSMG